jgi:hypothetical protein
MRGLPFERIRLPRAPHARTLTVRAGDSRLAEAALETVRHWAYRPLLVNGRAVEVASYFLAQK